MKLVKGNKIEEANLPNLSEFEKVIVDLGSGDGRFVYKSALENQRFFYIGIDPSVKSLEKFSKEANKKRLGNALFVVGSLENLPEELVGKTDVLLVYLPWGSLLQAVVKPTDDTVEKLKSLLKLGGMFEVVFGYVLDFEQHEVTRLELPEISNAYVNTNILPTFAKHGFNLREFSEVTKNELGALQTTWGKKLSFGHERKIYRLSMQAPL